MIAIVRAPFGARYFAASAEVAAVRSAVRIVISDNRSGIAGADVREDAERGDGLASLAHILRMPIDVFEGVDRTVACGHQFDRAFGGMRGDPRRLVEQLPAAEVLFDIDGEFAQKRLDPDIMHDVHHVLDADEGNEAEGSGAAGVMAWSLIIHFKPPLRRRGER